VLFILNKIDFYAYLKYSNYVKIKDCLEYNDICNDQLKSISVFDKYDKSVIVTDIDLIDCFIRELDGLNLDYAESYRLGEVFGDWYTIVINGREKSFRLLISCGPITSVQLLSDKRQYIYNVKDNKRIYELIKSIIE